MFGDVLRKTLRDLRWGMLGWGLGLGVVWFVVVFEYQMFAANAGQMAEFSKSYQAYGFLIGEFVPITTIGGFLTLEAQVYGALLLGVWAAIAAVGLVRGEEEPGALDVLLSTPHGRLAVLGQKLAALALALLGALALSNVGLVAGLWWIQESLPAGALLENAVNMLALAVFWAAAGMLIGQIVGARRTAAVLAGGLILALFLLDNVSATSPGLKGLAPWLPFHYYNLSKPLVPGRALDTGAWAVLWLAAAVLLALAAALFVRRDLGAGLALWPARRRPAAPLGSRVLLGSLAAKALRDQLGATLGWSAGLAVYAVVMVSSTKDALAPLYKGMNEMPWFTKLFGSLLTNESYLSVGVYFYLPVLLVLFALTQVWTWTGEEEDGRLDVVVSTPVPRGQVLLVRYLAALASLAVAVAVLIAALLGAVAWVDLAVDRARLVEGVLGAVPLALAVLTFGLALATWLPRPGPAVAVTGALLVAMFFLNALAPLFDWPDLWRRLSLFYYYNQPVLHGLAWGDVALVVGGAVLLAGASFAGFARRDLAR